MIVARDTAGGRRRITVREADSRQIVDRSRQTDGVEDGSGVGQREEQGMRKVKRWPTEVEAEKDRLKHAVPLKCFSFISYNLEPQYT
jgi:hypothetical protein